MHRCSPCCPPQPFRVPGGLPLNLNIGASYTTVPGTGLGALGGELRWAFRPGSALMPAVAARLGMSQTMGLDQLKLRSIKRRHLHLQRASPCSPLRRDWLCSIARFGTRISRPQVRKRGTDQSTLLASTSIWV